MIKSAVTFFRKQIGLRGKTQHNSRGAFEMSFEDGITVDNLVNTSRNVMNSLKSKGMLEMFEEDEQTIKFVLRDDLFNSTCSTEFTGKNQAYRKIVVLKQPVFGKPYAYVGMTFL